MSVISITFIHFFMMSMTFFAKAIIRQINSLLLSFMIVTSIGGLLRWSLFTNRLARTCLCSLFTSFLDDACLWGVFFFFLRKFSLAKFFPLDFTCKDFNEVYYWNCFTMVQFRLYLYSVSRFSVPSAILIKMFNHVLIPIGLRKK